MEILLLAACVLWFGSSFTRLLGQFFNFCFLFLFECVRVCECVWSPHLSPSCYLCVARVEIVDTLQMEGLSGLLVGGLPPESPTQEQPTEEKC